MRFFAPGWSRVWVILNDRLFDIKDDLAYTQRKNQLKIKISLLLSNDILYMEPEIDESIATVQTNKWKIPESYFAEAMR